MEPFLLLQGMKVKAIVNEYFFTNISGAALHNLKNTIYPNIIP